VCAEGFSFITGWVRITLNAKLYTIAAALISACCLVAGYFYSLIISFLMPNSSNFYTELDGNYQVLYLWLGERLTTFLDNKKACEYW